MNNLSEKSVWFALDEVNCFFEDIEDFFCFAKVNDKKGLLTRFTTALIDMIGQIKEKSTDKRNCLNVIMSLRPATLSVKIVTIKEANQILEEE
ncbi:CLUMA_CG005065, isoform A [Clunio marinus]|uniref:CLUMA_CG005065, isoform A n=1 Tax=Clunio marinus TaxID=568069 RepID=A0A1J1HTJ4_9DIPT|nr:CLUMA_CG005065, isoform A [Clunio marinus]